jgi:hypothetical protein
MKMGVRKTKTPKDDGIRNLNISLENSLEVTQHLLYENFFWF